MMSKKRLEDLRQELKHTKMMVARYANCVKHAKNNVAFWDSERRFWEVELRYFEDCQEAIEKAIIKETVKQETRKKGRSKNNGICT
jgi:hypothetical protein